MKKILALALGLALVVSGVAYAGGPGSVLSLVDQRLIQLGILSTAGTYVPPGVGTLTTIAVTTEVGSETVLTTGQLGSLVTNTGTTAKASCKLPANPSVGAFYDFLADDADGLRVVANTGQTITLDALGASASAGYVETIRQDSGFRLIYTASNTWRGVHMVGGWRKDSTTSAGFAFTPTSWTTWTPTGSWSANTTYTGRFRQSGSMWEGQVKVATSGAPTSANLTITLPVTSATDWQVTGNGRSFAGIGHLDNSFTAASLVYAWVPANSAVVMVVYPTAFAAGTWLNVTQAAPFTWGADDSLTLNIAVPVQ